VPSKGVFPKSWDIQSCKLCGESIETTEETSLALLCAQEAQVVPAMRTFLRHTQKHSLPPVLLLKEARCLVHLTFPLFLCSFVCLSIFQEELE
jgi:hypothetical protein